ncbi:hypothetical protein A3850_016855 [Lewinella sp. 4G2]|nr:hypothetical protein A3850_016855 [Lewinella sp. 4G2]
MRHLAIVLCLCACLLGCNRTARTYDFPRPVDTNDQPTDILEGKAWNLGNGISLSTNFPSARLTEVKVAAPGLITGFVPGENTPINVSPWYAFLLSSAVDTTLRVQLGYPNTAYHRYWPKLSSDGDTWMRIDSTRFRVAPDSKLATLTLRLTAGQPLWVAAQELHDVRRVETWIEKIARNPNVRVESVGTSVGGLSLPKITIRRPGGSPRRTIVVLSRQHPPEVAGYLAMKAFVEELLADPRFSNFIDRYQVLVYPLLNPDGVELGHWRHNRNGVDLNRDWAFYRQPEIRQVADDIVRTARKSKAPVVLGLDFHSTWKDVYYTHDDSVQPPSLLGDFKDRWLNTIETEIGGNFKINEEAEPIGRPTSMSWFRTQFNAEGITYEIGDDTPRDFVRRKGQVSARALITELMK